MRKIRLKDVSLQLFLIGSIIIFITIEHFRNIFINFDINYFNKTRGPALEIFFIVTWISIIFFIKLISLTTKNVLLKLSITFYYGLYFFSILFVSINSSYMVYEELNIDTIDSLSQGISSLSYQFYYFYMILVLWSLIKVCIHIVKYKKYLVTVIVLPLLLNLVLMILYIRGVRDLDAFTFTIYIPTTAIINIITAIAVLFLYPEKDSKLIEKVA